MKNSRAIWLLLLANSISGISQGISMLAIPWYFAHILNRGKLFGAIYFTVTAISLVWGLYAGTLIDKYDRRKIFLVMNVVGLIILTTVSIAGYHYDGLPWLAVAAIFAATAFFYNLHFPNLYAYVQEISSRENYGKITSLLEIQGQLTFTIAGAMAAILLKGVNGHMNIFGWELSVPFTIRSWKIYEIFALDAATYVVALLIIYNIKSLPVVKRNVDTSPLSERLKTGVRFLRKHNLLFLFGNLSLFVFLTIIITATYILPRYTDTFLKREADVYAFADMAFSVGALLAGFLTTRIFGDKSAVRGIIILSALAGMMYGVMAVNKILFLFFLAQFIIGACNAAVRIQRITYLFHHIPNHVMGRTNSIFFMLNVFGRLCLIGLFTIPFFQTSVGLAFTMAIFGLICVIAALGLWLRYKDLLSEPTKAS